MLNIVEYAWRAYPTAIDLLLYFFVFGAAARVSLAKHFPGGEGKALAPTVIEFQIVLGGSKPEHQSKQKENLKKFFLKNIG